MHVTCIVMLCRIVLQIRPYYETTWLRMRIITPPRPASMDPTTAPDDDGVSRGRTLYYDSQSADGRSTAFAPPPGATLGSVQTPLPLDPLIFFDLRDEHVSTVVFTNRAFGIKVCTETGLWGQTDVGGGLAGKCPAITHMRFHDCVFPAAGLRSLCGAVPNLLSLTVISAGYAASAAQAIRLARSCPRLQALHVSGGVLDKPGALVSLLVSCPRMSFIMSCGPATIAHEDMEWQRANRSHVLIVHKKSLTY